METFATPDEVVMRAQQILASRAYVPEDAKPLLANIKQNKDIAPLKEYIAMSLAGKDVEHCMAFYFSPDGRLISQTLVSKGTETMVQSYPRTILREGLLCNATFVVVAHNHPNGDKKPSEADQDAALRVATLCAEVGMELVMAFVVAGPKAEDVEPIHPPKVEEKTSFDEFIKTLTSSGRFLPPFVQG